MLQLEHFKWNGLGNAHKMPCTDRVVKLVAITPMNKCYVWVYYPKPSLSLGGVFENK